MFNLSLQKEGDLSSYTSPELLKELSVLVAFTTRSGGVSLTPFNSLNLAFHVDDNPLNVSKNREILCSTLKINPDSLTVPEQVHSDGVKVVDLNLKGSGAFSDKTAIKKTDALVTNLKNTPLIIFLADCVPVILVERKAKAVGIVHAGWQGTYKEITLKTLRLMEKTYDLSIEEMLVFIGPSVKSCCYEVSSQLFKNFVDKFSFAEKAFDRNFLDLQLLNKLQLVKVGVPEENIHVVNKCTCCEEELFFSYRRGKVTGRQAALVTIL